MQLLARTDSAKNPAADVDETDMEDVRAQLQARSRSKAFVWLGRLTGVVSICVMVALGALWMLHVRLAEGPIDVSHFMPQIAHDIENRIGVGYRIKMASASIERRSYGATLAVTQFVLLDPQGQSIIAAPRADVAINMWTVPLGMLRPSHIEVYDLAVHLIVLPDGGVTIAAGPDVSEVARDNPTASEPSAPALPQASTPTVVLVESELQHLLDTLLNADGILGGLEHVSVSQGTLYFDDRVTHQTTKFDHLELAYDKGRASATFDMSADGPNGRWSISATGDTLADAPRKFSLNIKDVSLDEVNLMYGIHDNGIDFDMPISANISGELLPAGILSSVKGALSIGAGFLFTSDPDQEPIWLDEVSSHFEWNHETKAFDIHDVHIFSGETSLNFSGVMASPHDTTEPWTLALHGDDSNVLGPQRMGDRRVLIPSSHIDARYFTQDKRIIFDKIMMSGSELSLHLSGDIGWAGARRYIKWDGVFERVPTHVALMIWPSVSAAPVRNYLQEHLHGGVLEKLTFHADLDDESLTQMRLQRPPRDGSIAVDFTLQNTNLTFLDNVPPLANIDAIGHVTGHTSSVKINRAYIELSATKKLILSEAEFTVADSGIKPTPAHINTHLTGTLDALGDFLARDTLKKFGGVQIDTANIKGQIESNLSLDLLLAKPDQKNNVEVKATSNVTNFSIDRLIGKEKLDNGSLIVVYENNSLRATGQGHFLGTTATIDLSKPADTILTTASISFLMDEVARTRLGFAPQGLSGPINVHFTGTLGQAEKSVTQAEIDFTKAAFDQFVPGLVKPAGRSSKATFVITSENERLHLDQILFDAGAGLGIKGTVDIDEAGNISAAHLPQLKLTAGDDARLDYERSDSQIKLNLRGGNFDAHAFIARLTSPDPKSSESETQRDLDIEIKLGQMTGANRKTMSGLELRYVRKANVARQFSLSARQGRVQLVGQLKRAEDGLEFMQITSADAGAFLSFLDLYKRMEGGQLILAARPKETGLEGNIFVNNFIVRDEPALRRIVTEGQERSSSGASQLNNINTSVASFDRLQIVFLRSNGVLIIKDGVMYGQQIGMNIDGRIDFARDTVNLSGTFVPAYGLNNLMSKIPLFGPVLLGGQHEGLFAINFRINGQASAPLLTINPLSAIAPGFLRKIFGVIDNGLNNQLPSGAADMPMSITPQPRR